MDTPEIEDHSLAEVLSGIVDADPEIIELDAESKGARLETTLENLVMQDYRCTIVSIVADAIEAWKAAGR